MKNYEKQKGAIIVEASLSLVIFIFMMITLYQVAFISMAQERIAVSLDEATKVLAEYSHVYYMTGMDDIFTGEGGKSSELINKITDNKVTEFLKELADSLPSNSSLGNTINKVNEVIANLQGQSITNFLKNKGSQLIVESLMKRNLTTSKGDWQYFVKKYHLVDQGGHYFRCHSNVKDGDIFIGVTYKIAIIKLLNIDITYNLGHWSYAKAWANGE